MFRNFFMLVYVALPSAALMAFATFLYKPTAEIGLFVAMFDGSLTMDNCTSELLNRLSLLRYGRYWWVFVIAVVVLACSACIMVVKIDRHMRTGLMPALPVKRALGILPSMLLYVVCCVAASELATLVAVGISYLIRFISNATAIVAVVLVLTFAVRALCAFVFGLLIVSFPLKYGENYRFNRAMSYSARLMFAKKGKLLIFALLYPLLRLAILGLAYLLQPYYLDWIVYGVAFLFAFTYVPCLSYKQYYDDVGGERRDVGQIIFG